MKFRVVSIALLLSCVGLGCRRDAYLDAYVEMLNAEKRALEDEIYELQYDKDALCRELEAYRANHERDSASDGGAKKSSKSLLKPRSSNPPPNSNDKKPPKKDVDNTPDTETPKIDMGTPTVILKDDATDAKEPALIDPNSSGTRTPPSSVIPKDKPDSTTSLREPKIVSGTPEETPRVEEPDESTAPGVPQPQDAPAPPTDVPPQGRPVPDVPNSKPAKSLADAPPAKTPASENVHLSEPLSSQWITQIVINPAQTGGADFDDRPGDDGVVILVEPRNDVGEFIPIAGPISVVLLDPAKTGEEARIDRWDFDEDEVKAGIKPGKKGIQLKAPWNNGMPENSRLKMFIRYETIDGRKLDTSRDISISVPGETTDRWTPRAGKPATSSHPRSEKSIVIPNAPETPSAPITAPAPVLPEKNAKDETEAGGHESASPPSREFNSAKEPRKELLETPVTPGNESQEPVSGEPQEPSTSALGTPSGLGSEPEMRNNGPGSATDTQPPADPVPPSRESPPAKPRSRQLVPIDSEPLPIPKVPTKTPRSKNSSEIIPELLDAPPANRSSRLERGTAGVQSATWRDEAAKKKKTAWKPYR